MAADRLVVCAEGMLYARKIKRVKTPYGTSLLGGCGSISAIHAFFTWMERQDRSNLPVISNAGLDFQFSALELRQDGSIWAYEELFQSYPVDYKYAAIGSGGQSALALMSIGWSPQDAVKQTRKIDAGTGGRVDVEWVK